MAFNVPALWRLTKFYSTSYPITQVASTQGTKQPNIDLKKYLSGDADTLSRLAIHLVGPVVVAGSGPGAATGNDNPGGLFVAANLVTSPVYSNVTPVNNVSSRGIHLDGILNAGFVSEDDPQAWLSKKNMLNDPALTDSTGGTPSTTFAAIAAGASYAQADIVAIKNALSQIALQFNQLQQSPVALQIQDVAGTYQIDHWLVIDFKRTPGIVRNGIEYGLPLAKYKTMNLQLTVGGRDQMFSGGTNTWDPSGLTLELWADLDTGASPKYIHAHELFENNYPVTATSHDFRIDNLIAGFEYTDLSIITENANAPVDGILNNVSIFSGGQVWLNKGETNAAALRYTQTQRNNRVLASQVFRTQMPGVYSIPLRDRMFTRGFDGRYAPIVMSLDVTSLSATTNIRLVGRRLLPGGILAPSAKAGQ